MAVVYSDVCCSMLMLFYYCFHVVDLFACVIVMDLFEFAML